MNETIINGEVECLCYIDNTGKYCAKITDSYKTIKILGDAIDIFIMVGLMIHMFIFLIFHKKRRVNLDIFFMIMNILAYVIQV